MEGTAPNLAGLVPSSSLGRQPSWRQKLDDGGSEVGDEGKPARKPPLQTGGSFTLKDPADIFDDNSLEGQIARIEKRLRKNLPHVTRANLELELEMLKDQKAMADAGQEEARPTAREEKAPARRKPGAVAMEGPDEPEPPKKEKKKKLVNRAAPKIQHPQTMARMQDWKKELDRRIKEQEELDGKRRSPSQQPGWFDMGAWTKDSPEKEEFKRRSGGSAGTDEDGNPLAALQGAATAVVEALAGALGLKEGEKEEEVLPDTRPLPKQTFSRRL